jgi:hypothetical protein
MSRRSFMALVGLGVAGVALSPSFAAGKPSYDLVALITREWQRQIDATPRPWKNGLIVTETLPESLQRELIGSDVFDRRVMAERVRGYVRG